MVCRAVRALRSLGRKPNGLAIGEQVGAHGNHSITHTKARVDAGKTIIGIPDLNRDLLDQKSRAR
jgi:hypothetical protein